MTLRDRLVPLIVACPLFLQNIDLSALNVALPGIAASLKVPPLQLNAVIAAYAIALAAFLPLSAWLADRFGPRRVFCMAIAVFSLASILCGLAQSAGFLVLCRVLQGFGAAMMVPVGRIILLRSVPPSEFVAAMAWFTIPPTLGRVLGPMVGGSIVTVASWRWIFLVNIPLGALILALALIYVPKVPREDKVPPFDLAGLLMLALGLGAMLGGLETMGKGMASLATSLALTLGGTAVLVAYAFYSLRQEHPAIDLRILRYRTFRANVVGALPMRCSASGVPFLLPLLFQIGFGLSAVLSGFIATGQAVGSLVTRPFMRQALKAMRFRTLLVGSGTAAAIFFASFGLMSASMSLWAIYALVVAAGLVSSICMVSLNAVGFVGIPRERSSHAAAMLVMVQQLSAALGVVLSAAMLTFVDHWRGGDGTGFEAGDFGLTFLAVGLFAALSLWPFAQLDDTTEITRSRRPAGEED
nr:MFS transporter [Novosphingobium flavum]